MNAKRLGIFRKLFVPAAALAMFLPAAVQAAEEKPLYQEAPPDVRAAEVPLHSLAPLVKRVKPGVVNIYTLSVEPVRPRRMSPFGYDPMDDLFRSFFEGQTAAQTRQSLGSGFILNSEGLVVTNNHVVGGAAEIRVKLDDGREFSAHPVGLDPKTDLALLQLEGEGVKDLPVVPLGDSDALEVGDFALAVGNPFGLDHSVSLGIVSAKERVIGAGPYDDFIQTDTAINPGNSGGPLFNLRGEVVGVNTAIMAQGQGIGFAVPVNMLKTLLPQLIRGSVVRGWMGVSVQDVPPNLVRRLGLAKREGAFVLGVIREGPAHRAGILPGDVVVSLAGKKIVSYNQFSRVVAGLAPGSRASVTVMRDGAEKVLEAQIASRPDEQRQAQAMRQWLPRSDDGQDASEQASQDKVDLGLTLRNVPRALMKRLGISGGVEIVAMDPASPLGKSGVRQGDVILEMQRRQVRDLRDFGDIASTLQMGERLLLRLQRGDTAIYVAAMLEPPEQADAPQTPSGR
jgi:periplasmic serine protease, Do/DeqQ family